MEARWLDEPGWRWKKHQREEYYWRGSDCQVGKELSVVSVRMRWMPAIRRLGTGMVGMIVLMMVMVVTRMGMRMIRWGSNGSIFVVMAMVQESEMERVCERLQREA